MLTVDQNLNKLGFEGDPKKTFAYLADAVEGSVEGGREISLIDFDRFEPVVEMYLTDIRTKQDVIEARVEKIHDTPTLPNTTLSALSAARLAEPELKFVSDPELRHGQVIRQRKAASPSILSPGDRVRGAITTAEAKQRTTEIAERNKMKQMAVKQDFQQIYQSWHDKKFTEYDEEINEQVNKQVEAVKKAKGGLQSPRAGPTRERARTGLSANSGS